MEPLFNESLPALTEAISEIRHNALQDFSGFSHFIKGDISGIQEFIFAVKSEKAAKTLKARSYFIQALSETCVYMIQNRLPGSVKLLYNGGGNFYLFAKKEIVDLLAEIQMAINETCWQNEFYVTLSAVEIKEVTNQFGEFVWRPLQQKSAADKLIKFEGWSQVFQPYQTPKIQEWEKFTPVLVRRKSWEIEPIKQKDLHVRAEAIEVLGHSLSLLKNGEKFNDSIANKIPRWSDELKDNFEEVGGEWEEEPKVGSVIEFQYLAKFAKLRTGTNKIAVLSMDIDSLGKLFDETGSIVDLQATSRLLSHFFDQHMYRMWRHKFTWKKSGDNGKLIPIESSFADNIYIVFSGGDDCFLLGAWDAVFEFTQLLQKEFSAFANFLKEKIDSVKKVPTLSAGLIVVDPSYPVVRFANLAKESLAKSKAVSGKDRITVFGQTLKWEEFDRAEDLGKRLQVLVQEKGESRAIIERIKKSASGFENLQQAALAGNLRAPKVSRLFYFLRNVKKENLKDVEVIIQDYSNALISAFQNKQSMNHMAFPVGARWAEFLTR